MITVPSFVSAVRTLAVLATVLMSTLLGRPASAAVDPAPPLDRWYALEMQGSPAGWMRATRTIAGDTITSASEMTLRVRRGELELSFGLSTEFVETAAGEPVRMSATTDLGGQPATQTYTWTEEGIVHTVSSPGGTPRTTTLAPPEGTWLTPAAATAYLGARLAAGAEEITLRTIDPLSGLRIGTTVRTEITPTTLEVNAREVEVFKTVGVADVQPGVETVEHLDRNGDPVRMQTQLGGLGITIIASDRATATGAPAGEAPELMTSLFISPSRPIPDAHSKREGVFVVRAKDGPLQAIPSTGYQRAERIDDSSFRVVVDMNRPGEDGGADLERAEFLASTVFLDASDSAVQALARRAMGGASDLRPAEIAERLRRFVHGHIRSKDLTVGFATASEVARSGEGDCTEHAVLLAALLRTQGIPSRVVGGLIYADRFAGGRDIFGYHAWTQALVTDEAGVWRWIDVDATLPGRRGYSAAHIALSVSSLADAGPVGGLTDLAPLLGRLEIDVEMVR